MNPVSKESQLHGWKSGPKPKNAIAKMSTKRKGTKKEYDKVRKECLSKYPICQVEGCKRFATDIHHRKGRLGALLCDVTHFLAVCRGCHQKIEINPTWAKENGYSESRLDVNDVTVYE
jgi:hypothetical protein